MNKKVLIIAVGIFLAIISAINLLRPESLSDNFPEKVKIALRDAGNQLLLANQDSTSLILPIKALQPLKYKLSFEKPLKIEPDSLVRILDNSLSKTELPNEYLTEVLQCIDNEVAYSFDMKKSVDTDVIPCLGRDLPQNCYTITVQFTNMPITTKTSYGWYLLLATGFFIMSFGFFSKKTPSTITEPTEDHVALGSFYFYPEQNKLVKQATEINLSKKECEILALFVERPNQIIKRDDLTKAVWEDNGVFVGRSLDTYISKLRKKLQSDSNIKLTNVHGVGYKLEVPS